MQVDARNPPDALKQQVWDAVSEASRDGIRERLAWIAEFDDPDDDLPPFRIIISGTAESFAMRIVPIFEPNGPAENEAMNTEHDPQTEFVAVFKTCLGTEYVTTLPF